ncbi:DNA recombination protein RmuC [Vineibacter terrae]|uniref:DNA recombination protein RmuC homolog n=1 Tax=Vineibacter terrae TaxID=2586908 RepID=A0A5C8PBW1_9HYPH|nr:DNA recombination protein RmuC [Vineibacter terrae]TXL70853.1 DNA recombination protein RmuC [Vineibacter terrae]
MIEIMLFTALVLGALAALFGVLAYLRLRRLQTAVSLTPQEAATLLRAEHDRLRDAVDGQSRNLRTELGDNLRGFQETTLKGFGALGTSLEAQAVGIGERVKVAVEKIEAETKGIAAKLDAELARMVEDATTGRDRLRGAIDERLEKSAQAQTDAGKDLRDQVLKGVGDLGKVTSTTLNQISEHQKERLDKVAAELARLVEQQDQKLGEIRTAVEGRLDKIRTENADKLEEMRRTVDEKLQSTLDARLGESFNRVVEQLERVHHGIGEMRTLATGVGDLKKVLSNVTVRGALGEIQLAMLLEQFLSPEQMIRNAAVRDDTQERVEFAVKLPGRDDKNEVLLPIDAKFPQEDYQRLLAAVEQGDLDGAAAAGQALEARIRLFAKTIREKYVHPPRTTDFAVLFLPTEGLYAEVLRRPGLFEQLQRDHHVTLAGPTTLTALLNALQMGFRSVAIEKRSSEVWQVLGAVRTEFGKYNEVVDRIGKQLTTAANSVDALGRRTRAMGRKLRSVETLPEAEASMLLGLAQDGEPTPEGELVAAQ